MPKAASFKLSDTGNFSVTSGKHGSFKVTLNASGGFASPLAKEEFPGLTLDQIEPLNELGAGAGGTVRLARHRPTGRPLALKIMHILGNAREQRHAFLNELRVLCKLNHANLVPMYDCFQLDGIAYLALKYMDGGSLESCCAKYRQLTEANGSASGGLPEPVLASLLLQSLCGLSHLHARSMMHRDLKPANILLDARSGVTMLADFGITTEVEEAAHGLARSFVGTAAYMAPERLNGQVYSDSADLWSLGMIGLECAQGQHPWKDATSYYDLVMGVSECEQAPCLPIEFSADLRELTTSCLAPRPADRPSSHALLTHHFLLRSIGLATPPEGEQPEAARPPAGGHKAADVAAAFVQIGERGPPPPEQCAMVAARVVREWLASSGLVVVAGSTTTEAL